ETIVDFFEESGLDMVSKRIQQLEEQDLERQIWNIRASITSVTLRTEQEAMPRLHLHPSQSSVTYERLITAARSVGDRLCKLALHGEDSVGWVGVDVMMDREWHLLPTSTDLYSGTSGIALFLAYLGLLADEERYTTLARVALASTRSQVVRQKEILELTGIGIFERRGA